MTDSDMFSALLWGALGLGCLIAAGAVAIVVLSGKVPTPPVPPGVRFAPDAPSVEDLELALEHDALIEDVEVAWLESIPTMKWDPERLL